MTFKARQARNIRKKAAQRERERKQRERNIRDAQRRQRNAELDEYQRRVNLWRAEVAAYGKRVESWKFDEPITLTEHTEVVAVRKLADGRVVYEVREHGKVAAERFATLQPPSVVVQKSTSVGKTESIFGDPRPWATELFNEAARAREVKRRMEASAHRERVEAACDADPSGTVVFDLSCHHIRTLPDDPVIPIIHPGWFTNNAEAWHKELGYESAEALIAAVNAIPDEGGDFHGYRVVRKFPSFKMPAHVLDAQLLVMTAEQIEALRKSPDWQEVDRASRPATTVTFGVDMASEPDLCETMQRVEALGEISAEEWIAQAPDRRRVHNGWLLERWYNGVDDCGVIVIDAGERPFLDPDDVVPPPVYCIAQPTRTVDEIPPIKD